MQTIKGTNYIQQYFQELEGCEFLALNKDANSDDIENIKQFTKYYFKIEPPQEYFDFIKKINGVNHFGLVLYGTNEIEVQNKDNYKLWFLGFIEENKEYGEQFDYKYLVFGQCDCDLLIYNIEDKQYYRFDHINLCESYGTFNEMLNDVLKYLI